MIRTVATLGDQNFILHQKIATEENTNYAVASYEMVYEVKISSSL